MHIKNRLRLAPLALCFFAISGCHSAANWSGIWDLDLSRGSIPGPTFTVTAKPNGFYGLAGGGTPFQFACDGKQYPTPENRTMSCKETPSTMESTTYVDGKAFRKGEWTLSENEEVLTITLEASADGKIPAEHSRYHRLKSTLGSSGFAGSWKDEHPLERQPKTLVIGLDKQSLHLTFKDQGRSIDLPLTGSGAHMQGPNVPPDETMRITSHGYETFFIEHSVHGKVQSVISFKLGLDNRTMMEQFGPPGSTARATLIYHKRKP